MTELEASDRDLVRTLGGRLNLGGGYANALCDLTGIEGSRMATDVAADPSEVEALASELAKLLACIGPSRDRTSWLMLASEDGTPDDVLIAQAMAPLKALIAMPSIISGRGRRSHTITCS